MKLPWLLPLFFLFLASCSSEPKAIDRTAVDASISGNAMEAASWFQKSLTSALAFQPGEVIASTTDDETVRIEIPSARFLDSKQLLDVWVRQPKLGFAKVHSRLPSGEAPPTELANGTRLVSMADASQGFVVVSDPPEFDGSIVAKAESIFEADKAPEIRVSLVESSHADMLAFTTANLEEPVAILIGDEAVSAPVVRDPFSEAFSITGNFTFAEALALAAYLQSPPSFAFSFVEAPPSESP